MQANVCGRALIAIPSGSRLLNHYHRVQSLRSGPPIRQRSSRSVTSPAMASQVGQSSKTSLPTTYPTQAFTIVGAGRVGLALADMGDGTDVRCRRLLIPPPHTHTTGPRPPR